MRTVSHGLRYCTLGSHFVVLTEEVMEPLEVGALLEEVCPWGWGLRIYNLTT